MPPRIELLAPAKINLTLEVLGKREDGYHEIASVIQTLDLCDRVVLEPAHGISLEVHGEAAAGVPSQPEQDLAYRAAARMAYWATEPVGVKITLEKNIPAGMGLGGGSSDAAAVVRGLNHLWGLGRDAASLCRTAAELGSDVAFFVHCGTALCRGRGERVDPLVDCKAPVVTLFLPRDGLPEKTATMYRRLTSADYSAGTSTRGMIDDIAMRGALVTDGRNVFDKHADAFGEELPVAMEACNRAGFEVHLAGSGPAFFALRPKAELPPRELALLEWMGIQIREYGFLGREEALRVREL